MQSAGSRTFVGFGFGAIQAGLFLYEAHRSGNFNRLVIAEVMQEVVEALRRSGGCYQLNVATANGIKKHVIPNIEIYNPTVPADADALVEALSVASEIATALPSVDFFDRGNPSVAGLLARALNRKAIHSPGSSCVVYTAENHNHAAEILQELCCAKLDKSTRDFADKSVQFLNTVIGKMSGVVTDAEQIKTDDLTCLIDGCHRAILVEEFNRILITQIQLPGFQRGIEAFVEKPDLLPFEQAKLYGHNATHALIGYLAHHKGYQYMSEVANDKALMALARAAFIEESGAALIARYQGLDPLFTPDGYRAYVEDLLVRMTNPYLRDLVDRVIRDPRRKLGWDDRLIGTMRLALDVDITPGRFALGAAAAIEMIGSQKTVADELNELWTAADQPPGRKTQLIQLITEAQAKLKTKES